MDMRVTRRIAERRQSQRGSVFVETAFIFVVFSATLLGIWDFGQQLFVHQMITDRTRAAARWGAVNNPKDTTGIRNMVMYQQSATPVAGTPSFMGLTASNIAVSDPGQGTDNYRVVVVVSGYTYTSVSIFSGGNRTGLPVTVTVPLDIYD